MEVAWWLLASYATSSDARRGLMRRAALCLALAAFLAAGLVLAELCVSLTIPYGGTHNWYLATECAEALGGLVVAIGFVVMARVFRRGTADDADATVSPPPPPSNWHDTAFDATPAT